MDMRGERQNCASHVVPAYNVDINIYEEKLICKKKKRKKKKMVICTVIAVIR